MPRRQIELNQPAQQAGRSRRLGVGKSCTAPVAPGARDVLPNRVGELVAPATSTVKD